MDYPGFHPLERPGEVDPAPALKSDVAAANISATVCRLRDVLQVRNMPAGTRNAEALMSGKRESEKVRGLRGQGG